jgi:phage shock protein PspC (stress-responsive transcriptional regulator)
MTNPRAEDEPGADRVPEPEHLPEPERLPEPGRVPEPEPLAQQPGEAGEPTPTTEPSAAPVDDIADDLAEPLPAEPEPADTVETAVTDSDAPTVAQPAAGDEPPSGPRPDDPRLAGGAFPPPSGPPPSGPPPSGPPPGGPPPGGPPPGAPGFPPPGGFPPPPPGTAGWATRYGLVRPAQGRVFAGVCAAIGRATNTDPVLWRVLLAVFTLAGGIGLIVYVLGWLLIPDEGDTASPLEALFGRGRSRTNPLIVILVAIGAAIGLASVFSRSFPSAVIPFGLIVLAIVLFGRRTGQPVGYPPPVPPMTGSGPVTPGYQPAPGPVPPDAPQYRPPSPRPVEYAQTPGGPAPQPAGYRPPFAPHGPYAGAGPYPYPGLSASQPPPFVPPPAPVPPRPPAPRSRLGLVTLSMVLLAVGTLAIIGLASGGLPIEAYFAAALAAVGLGLVVGAWVGRARWLIAPGILLSLALALSTAVHRVGPLEHGGGDVTWAPTSVAEVSDNYRHGVGTVRIDMSQVNFTDYSKTVNVHVNLGDVRVTLPSDVDVVVRAEVDTGDGQVFDTRWSGVSTPQRTIADDGADGPGGGHLLLIIKVNVGSLEVTR